MWSTYFADIYMALPPAVLKLLKTHVLDISFAAGHQSQPPWGKHDNICLGLKEPRSEGLGEEMTQALSDTLETRSSLHLFLIYTSIRGRFIKSMLISIVEVQLQRSEMANPWT